MKGKQVSLQAHHWAHGCICSPFITTQFEMVTDGSLRLVSLFLALSLERHWQRRPSFEMLLSNLFQNVCYGGRFKGDSDSRCLFLFMTRGEKSQILLSRELFSASSSWSENFPRDDLHPKRPKHQFDSDLAAKETSKMIRKKPASRKEHVIYPICQPKSQLAGFNCKTKAAKCFGNCLR